MEEVQWRFKREETYVYLELIHSVEQQKLTRHWKAAILQFRKNKLSFPIYFPSILTKVVFNEVKVKPMLSFGKNAS